MGLKVVEQSKAPIISDAFPVVDFIRAISSLGGNQAEEDARVLIQAEEIRRDPARFRKAKALLQGAIQ